MEIEGTGKLPKLTAQQAPTIHIPATPISLVL
jgi:hypothetical protein